MVYVPAPPNAPPPERIEWPLTSELAVNRLNTAVFIAADPVEIELRSSSRVRTPGGGSKRVTGAVRPLQRFKLIMVSAAGGSIDQATEDGLERRVDFVLLGEWDAEIAVGDWWDDDRGNRFEVLSMIPANGYEVRANVSATGKLLEGG